LYLKNNICESQ